MNVRKLIARFLRAVNQAAWELMSGRFAQETVQLHLTDDVKPSNVKMLFESFASFCLNCEDFRTAEGFLRLALAVDPEDAETQAQMAFVRFKQGRFDAAVETARQAVSLDPNSWFGWAVMGRAALRLQDWRTAAHALHQVVWLSGDDFEDPRHNRLLAFALDRLGAGNRARLHRERAKEILARWREGGDACEVE